MASPNYALQTMLNNIPDKTGKTLGEWKVVLADSGFEKYGQMLKLLKTEHGVTHGFANLIVTKFREDGSGDIDLVAAQYSGGKAELRPIYDVILAYAKSLGDDVEVAPKKSSVSLRRAKQFALIIPATKTRIDLGLALKGEPPAGRLETYNAMCSHRVRINSIEEFDDEVKGYVALAYERCG